jgi:hypothetical protein
MSTSEHGIPPALRARVFADLRPVRPLADPWRRALAVVPVAALLFVAAHVAYGTRRDLGGALLWGASLVQVAMAIGLAVAALREVIPDRSMGPAARVTLFLAGCALALLITGLAWHASGTVAPDAKAYVYWKYCLAHTIEFGLPILTVMLVLASRGVIWRPTLVGGLAGLAAGLSADAAWRTFCSVSEPSHVLTAHFGGIVVLVVTGALAARVVASFRRPR